MTNNSFFIDCNSWNDFQTKLGSDKKLEWICQKNNHKSWFATPSNIKPTSTKQGSWCPECWKEKTK